VVSELWCEEHDNFKRSCPWCEIEELEAEIEQLKQSKQWISVKERLPKSGDTVLVYYRRGEYRGTYILRYIGGLWLIFDPLIEVTHWMPLPEPPRGDNS
jgi:hypothetical protein